jgi:hypothetical protein
MAVEPRLFLGRGSNNREGLWRRGKRPSRRRRHTSQGRTGSLLWAFPLVGQRFGRAPWRCSILTLRGERGGRPGWGRLRRKRLRLNAPDECGAIHFELKPVCFEDSWIRDLFWIPPNIFCRLEKSAVPSVPTHCCLKAVLDYEYAFHVLKILLLTEELFQKGS